VNDLDQVREFRAEVLPPDARRMYDGRSRFSAAIAAEPPRVTPLRRAFRRPRFGMVPMSVPAAVAAAVVAAVVAIGTIAVPGAGHVVRHNAAPAPRLTLTAAVLRDAAAAAAAWPASKPGAHTWFYTKSVTDVYGRATTMEGWVRFDGREDAFLLQGRLVLNPDPAGPGGADPIAVYIANPNTMTSYDVLAALPRDPSKMLALVAEVVAKDRGAGVSGVSVSRSTQPEREFGLLSELLWDAFAAVPPRAAATVYRAMALIPGLHVRQGLVNAAGKPAIGLSLGDSGLLLIDPVTYRVIGSQFTSQSVGKLGVPRDPKARAGSVAASEAWVVVREVSGPGQR
jgi:hypothetical protein